MQRFTVGQEVRVLAHPNPRFVGHRAWVVIARPEEDAYYCAVEECGAMGVEFTGDQMAEVV